MRNKAIEWSYLKDVPADRVGRLVREYLAESEHGGFEGFTSADYTGIRRLLEDMKLYYESAVKYDPEAFTKLSNVNPN